VNAFIHRDYSISDDIQVLLFNDRIEVRSPGRLPGYVRVENILDARYSRNPKIVRTLNWYPNPPNKDLGEGLNTAFQKMKEWGRGVRVRIALGFHGDRRQREQLVVTVIDSLWRIALRIQDDHFEILPILTGLGRLKGRCI
jgi:hypothetical protein